MVVVEVRRGDGTFAAMTACSRKDAAMLVDAGKDKKWKVEVREPEPIAHLYTALRESPDYP